MTMSDTKMAGASPGGTASETSPVPEAEAVLNDASVSSRPDESAPAEKGSGIDEGREKGANNGGDTVKTSDDILRLNTENVLSCDGSPPPPLDENIVEKLTAGFLQTFRPEAERSNTILEELMRNQQFMIETLQQENDKFKENNMMSDLTGLMAEAKRYHSKLVHLRKEMVSLHDKSTKMKKRALKLQNQKLKQHLQKEQQREREMEQEKHLIAKPAKKTP